jgi:dTDP-4-amino-4,6-dideoxygalactose transaminase
VGNGYDALVIAIRSLGIGAGDEVIVPSNTYIATVNAVMAAGARPVLVEPDVHTYNITAAGAAKALTPKTKAILQVHLYGQACEMQELMALAKTYNLNVIEDAAQAHGARYRQQRVGTFGHAGAFSFYPSKNLGAMGDGGAVVTTATAAASFVRKYRNYGEAEKYHNELIGVNSRLDALQAAVLRAKLPYLDQLNAERQRLAQIYSSSLANIGDLILPFTAAHCGHVFHIYTIRTNYRDALRKWLQDRGILTGIHYPVPVHLQPAYSFLKYKPGDFPLAAELAGTSLSLPLFPGMLEQEQSAVIESIKLFFRSV